MDDENYIVVKESMVTELKLKGSELLAYALIYGFSQDGNSWFQGSQSYIAKWCCVSQRQIIKTLKKLEEKGCIEKKETIWKNGSKHCYYRAIRTKFTEPSEQSSHSSLNKVHIAHRTKFTEPSEQSSHSSLNKVHIAHRTKFTEPSEQSSHNNIDINNSKDNIVIKNSDYKEIYREIIDFLNLKCGTHYTTRSKKTQSLIHARLSEGFTVEDFQTVIVKKSEEWLDDERMNKFLRPETLFGTKFESYLNQPYKKKKSEESFYERLERITQDLDKGDKRIE